MEVCEAMFIELFERVKYMESGQKLNFTGNEKMMLKLSFNAWVGGDMAAKGFEMFLKMFQNNPETQKLFDFAKGSSAAQLQNSSRMLFHVTRVVKNIHTVVHNLDKLENVVPTLREVGGRHCGFGVPSNYFPYLGVAMRQLMAQQVKNWTSKHDALWNTLYTWIAQQLVEGQNTYGKK